MAICQQLSNSPAIAFKLVLGLALVGLCRLTVRAVTQLMIVVLALRDSSPEQRAEILRALLAGKEDKDS